MDFRRRRFLNWFPMGLTYAFLYMGRYNLTVAKNALGDAMTKEDFGIIFAAGTLTYAFAFLINGPLTDKMGGRRGILLAAFGSALMNLILGLYINFAVIGAGYTDHMVPIFSVVYAINMYFQSFGAVSIVKVNSNWFHVRERGGFGGIFGTMIASGIFFAFFINPLFLSMMADPTAPSQLGAAMWVFFLPSLILFAMWGLEVFLLRDTPSKAGLQNFDTGDASSGESDAPVPTLEIMKRIFTNPIIMTVAFIEFCTGAIRDGVMHWFQFYTAEALSLPDAHALRNGSWSEWYTIVPFFILAVFFFVLAAKAKSGKGKAWYIISGALLAMAPFMQAGVGGMFFVSGVIGANAAGWISDLFLQSRRIPAAGAFYVGMFFLLVFMYFVLPSTSTRVEWAADDPKAVAGGFDQLQPGDTIVEIAGVGNLTDWTSVNKAVACLPSACKNSFCDTKTCMCTTKPAATLPAGAAVSAGFIPTKVLRGETLTELRLRDPGATMRAGDKRKLKAGSSLGLNPFLLGVVVFLLSMSVVGTHGMLSGTASMDFGGRKGAGTAVGVIDGFVYLGVGTQSLSLGYLTSKSWSYWPLFLIPFTILGFVLCLRIWNAKPGKKHH
jgi:OPA family glycerol-3-phosphate transporter-like MFS transporter